MSLCIRGFAAAVLPLFPLADGARADAGAALRFGTPTNAFVQVAHHANLNSYPLTVTAWTKTSTVRANYDGIVNKYAGASADGYSMHVYNGRLYAWYFRGDGSGTNRVYTHDFGLDGGLVADGQWHHVAFTVGPTGGRLIVDGVQRAFLPWTGTPGPPTTNTPVLLGQYPAFGAFAGQMDEVTIWNRESTAAELAAVRHVTLAGNEPGLVAYWRLDEASGTVAYRDGFANYAGLNFRSPAQGAPQPVDRRFGPRGECGKENSKGPAKDTRNHAKNFRVRGRVQITFCSIEMHCGH